MTKVRSLILLSVVIVALAAIFVRYQPSGSATIFRSGDRVVVRTMPLYIRASGTRCRAQILGDQLRFEDDAPAASATNDEFTVHLRFAYTPPSELPAGWPAGSWCDSLGARADAEARRASARFNVTDLLDRRRSTGDAIASAVESELPMKTNGISARIDLPPGFERLRPVAEVASRAHQAPPVIFIGLDGADWELLDRFMAAGSMPNLQRLVSHGVRGPLETEMPPLSPIVWTTMMTGVSPLQHQILDFTRFNPITHQKEPITSDERRAPAIWNMLTYAGKETAVFGLWATYAAEPVHGINVSDRLFTFLYSEAQHPAGVVYPPQRQAWAEREVAAAERSVDLATIRTYLPALTENEFAALSQTENPYANPAAALDRILVDTEIYRRLSLDYLKGLPRLPDLTIVYFEGTDTIGHEFAPFAPPKQPEVSEADYERYHAFPEKYFHYIDTILGDYSALAARDHAVIVLASDHGFHWIEGRPTEVSSTATATAAKWHRKEGVFLLSGESSPLPHGIRDVCGTLLDLTGMPQLDYAKYFQRAAPPPAPSARAAGEELAKLRALGYIGANESLQSAVPQTDTKTAGAWNNEGLILRDDKRIDEAVVAFQRAMAIDPHYASPMWNLSETLFDAHRDLDRADALLIQAMQNGLPEAARYTIVRSIAYQKAGAEDHSLRLLENAVAAAPDNAELRMFRGRYRIDRHQCRGALGDFLAAERLEPANALAFASAGLAQMCLGDNAAAQQSFARAHGLDPTLRLP